MTKITKSEKKLREGLNKWKSFLNEGAFKPQVQEARMGEYGKIDAEDGNPPSKIGRGNEEYMAAYNAVLQARGEQPLDIQQPDQAYLDALQQGRMKPSDHSYNLEEGNAEFEVGDEVIANGYPGTITDLSIPGMATVDLGRQGETTVSLSDIEHRFYKGDFGMELYDLDENITDVKVGDKVNIIGGAVVGAYGEVIELTKVGGIGAGPDAGNPAFVVKLEGDADKRIYGGVGDEVIIQPKFVEKMRMGDPDVMYGSDDEYDDLDERSADDDRDLEEPVKYGTGHELEWDPKEEKLYDRKRDYYLSQEEEDAVVAARQAEVDRKHKEFDMRRQNREFGSAPYHFEEGAGHDESIAQAQNQGVAFIRGQDDRAAGKEKDPNFSEESGRNPLEVLFYNAGYDKGVHENFSEKTEGANPAMNLQSKAKGKAMGLLQTAKAMAQAPSTEPARGFAAAVAKGAGEIVDLMVELEGFQASGYMEESNEPFDMDAHMAAYENEPETIEYRKQIKQLVQMVADKKGIPVEQAAEEIASYVVTAGGMKEAIGMQNIEKRRKPAAAAPAGGKINPTTIAKQFIKDRGYDKHFDLSDVFKVMALTDYLRKAGANTEEKVQAAVIDYIQHDGQSLKEGVGDKEARIRDVVKMGSWDNIDGVSLSLPQAELLVAAMDNLNDTNKKKLMAMPIDKMLDIVNRMVDAGVITVNYGRAGLREMMGASRTTYSSDPELDQIEDIAKDMLEAGIQNGRIPVGLDSVASALQAQGFDATVSSDVLSIDGKYFMGREDQFDISPNEDVRRVMGFILGYMG